MEALSRSLIAVFNDAREQADIFCADIMENRVFVIAKGETGHPPS